MEIKKLKCILTFHAGR